MTYTRMRVVGSACARSRSPAIRFQGPAGDPAHIGAVCLVPPPRFAQSFCFKNSGFVSIEMGVALPGLWPSRLPAFVVLVVVFGHYAAAPAPERAPTGGALRGGRPAAHAGLHSAGAPGAWAGPGPSEASRRALYNRTDPRGDFQTTERKKTGNDKVAQGSGGSRLRAPIQTTHHGGHGGHGGDSSSPASTPKSRWAGHDRSSATAATLRTGNAAAATCRSQSGGRRLR